MRELVVSQKMGVERSRNNTAPRGGITSKLKVVSTPKPVVRLSLPLAVVSKPVNLISYTSLRSRSISESASPSPVDVNPWLKNR